MEAWIGDRLENTWIGGHIDWRSHGSMDRRQIGGHMDWRSHGSMDRRQIGEYMDGGMRDMVEEKTLQLSHDRH